MTDNNRQPFSPQTALDLPYRPDSANEFTSANARRLADTQATNLGAPRQSMWAVDTATTIERRVPRGKSQQVYALFFKERGTNGAQWIEFPLDTTSLEMFIRQEFPNGLPVQNPQKINWLVSWRRSGERPVTSTIKLASPFDKPVAQEIPAVSNQPVEKTDNLGDSHSPDELTEAGIERKSTHWITAQHKTWWPRVRSFAAWAGIPSNEQDAWIHKALKVNSVKDFTGNETVATETVFKEAIRQYYRKHVAEMLQTDFQEATGFSSLESATAQGSLTYQEIMRLVEVHAAKELAAPPLAEIAPPTSATPVTAIGTQETPQNTPAGKSATDKPATVAVASNRLPAPKPTIAPTANPFRKATKGNSKLRLAIGGVPGGGKTFTALEIATELFPAGKIAVLDTEWHSAEKYAEIFNFDVLDLDGDFSPENYINAIHAAENNGYDLLIIDSLSHEWEAPGGILSIVDSLEFKTKDGRDDTRAKWKLASPRHQALITTILQSKIHIIATMRCKWKPMKMRDADNNPITIKIMGDLVQRDRIGYEFDIVAMADEKQTVRIDKSRCPELTGYAGNRNGKELARRIAKWLNIPQPTSTDRIAS